MDGSKLLEKQANKQVERSISQKEKMNEGIQNICKLLVNSSSNFSKDDINTFINAIDEYTKKYDRIIYSVISNFIFTLSEESIGIMITNLEDVVEFILSDSYEDILKDDSEVIKQTNFQEIEKLRKIIIKIDDHIHLAIFQMRSLKQNEEDFTKNFNINIVPIKDAMQREQDKFTREMNAQLISLIGIFTALSFLVFGGISSLDNIFEGANRIPILQVMIIGSIWGLCISNLIFIFMFFVSKMTHLNIKSCEDDNCSLIQKYPLIFWCNLVIATILLLSSWLYYIDDKNIGGWFINIGNTMPMLVSISGLFLICAFFVITARRLIRKK